MKSALRSFMLGIFCLSAPLFGAAQSGDPSKAYPVVILGGGIGALTSALYMARAGLEPIVLEGANPGGLITQSHRVENWPGELEISGADLAEKIHKQAEANGVQLRGEEVVAVDFSKRPFTITTRAVDGDGSLRVIQTESCIIAMGTQSNYLNIPGEQPYWGRGVSNCAICDGSLFRDRTVAIVGGGDAAIAEGLYLSNIARDVYVLVRKDSFRTVEEKRLQALMARPNVKVLFNTQLKEIKGDGTKVTHAALKTGEQTRELPIDGIFLAIGSTPNTSLFKGALKLDRQGYIELSHDQQTSIEGVYAIGDIVDPVYKQAISAAGDGAKAAMQVQKYLADRATTLIAKPAPVKKTEPSKPAEVVEIYSLEQFEKELNTSDVPVLVDFYATWCGPCKRITPLIERSAGHLSGKVKFLKVNVDKFHMLSNSYQVTAMPTLLLFDTDGSVVERKIGADEIADLLKRLEKDKG